MRNKIMLTFIIVFAFIFSSTSAQDLPQLVKALPDPAEIQGNAGEIYQKDYQYKDNLYDTYLYDLPKDEDLFLTAYSKLVEKAGYQIENAETDGVPSLRIIASPNKTSAILFYNYQGHMLLLVPSNISFTLKNISEIVSLSEEKTLSPAEANELGDRYANGDGVELNYDEAVKYYRIAADQGDPEGQCNLGASYYYGKGIKQDYEESLKWYRLAAEQGSDRGQYNVGLAYYYGEGVDQDYKESYIWLLASAEQNNSNAQSYLGYMYEIGEGVDQDYTEASKWYRLAAEQGNSEAQGSLGYLYDIGLGVDKNYNEAVKWYRLAAEQNVARAQNNLGACYHNGEGVKQDYDEAVKWYTLSAENGDDLAQYNLALCYLNGTGVKVDYRESARWLLVSANQDNSDAQLLLGFYYEKGIGVKADNSEAIKWYELAAQQGNETAKEYLDALKDNIIWEATSAPKVYTGYATIQQNNDVGVLLRDTPSYSSEILRSILNGTQIKYVGDYKVINGETWVLIETKEKQQGWILETSALPVE